VRIRLPRVAAPAHKTLADVVGADLTLGVLLLHLPDSTAKTAYVVFHQQSVCGENAVSQETNAFSDGKNLVLAGMQAKTQPTKELGNLVLDICQG
ncbi:MAG: hypothetical protein ACC628_27705, partial [Pirellulaceae bacterium]